MLNISYAALAMEVATRYDERTLLTGVESLFAFVGLGTVENGLV